jgi:hypothetical protein
VGHALTAWEAGESALGELFDALVASQPSNRAAFSAFTAVSSSSARTQLVEAAFKRAMRDDDPAYEDTARLIYQFSKFGARRNELAHGRVFSLGEHGFMLGPNNTNPNKWKNGSATYQYTSADIAYYATQFAEQAIEIQRLASALVARNIAAVANKSRKNRRGRTA